jgi:uncharacterized protein YbjT (DUF2867 family)
MVLVTGANGRTGREVLKLLHSRGTPVRAMVRDVSKATGLPVGAEMVVAILANHKRCPVHSKASTRST